MQHPTAAAPSAERTGLSERMRAHLNDPEAQLASDARIVERCRRRGITVKLLPSRRLAPYVEQTDLRRSLRALGVLTDVATGTKNIGRARTAPRRRGAGRPAARPSARSGDSGDSGDSDSDAPGEAGPPVAGASVEALVRHADHHSCLGGAVEVPCPCGDSIALVCDVCGEAVFVAVAPGTWCEHARQLVGG